jgi:hypothetical protein
MKKFLSMILFLQVIVEGYAQVDMPTGGAVFSLPMLNWQDDKSRLNLNVSLNYSSGNGLKVNAIASNIGQGWDLEAGGVITRMQAGEPDDQKPYSGNNTPDDVTRYPAGMLYATEPTPGCAGNLLRYPLYKDQNHLYKNYNLASEDKELDHFSFSFNGQSGMFVLTKDDSALLLADATLRVWYTRDEAAADAANSRTTIDAFYIQDENGLIYKFAVPERTKVLKTKYCSQNQQAQLTQPNFQSGHMYFESAFDDNDASNPLTIPLVKPWVTTAWYLKSITDPLTGRVITFNYNTATVTNSSGIALSYMANKNYTTITHTISISQTPEINTIEFPDKPLNSVDNGHRVVFGYGSNRVDNPGEQALASIDVQYNGRHLSEYLLTTSYFIRNRYGTPSSADQIQSARLALLGVQRIGADLRASEPAYRFDYYLGSSNPYDFVPPPFFHMKDIWGYYNGNLSVDAAASSGHPIDPTINVFKLTPQQVKGLCYVNDADNSRFSDPTFVPRLYNVNPGYAKNGLLKRIYYPSGGTLLYQYAQNKGTVDGQYRDVGGVHVSQTQTTDGGFSNGCGNPLLNTYNYTSDLTNTTSSMYIMEAPRNSMAMENVYDAESKYYKMTVFGGHWDYHYKYPGLLSRDQAVNLSGSQKFWVAFSKVMNVVGTVMDIIDIVNLCLDATPAAILAVALDVVGAVVDFVVGAFSNLSKDINELFYYNSDINGSNPLPMGFSRLQVVGGGGGDGSTVYEYTNPTEPLYPLWQASNPSLSQIQRYGYWEYGLPEKITVYDKDNNIVKRTSNSYAVVNADYYERIIGGPGHGGLTTYDALSCKCLVAQSQSWRNDDWTNANVADDPSTYAASNMNTLLTVNGVGGKTAMLVLQYYYTHGRMELLYQDESIYKPGDQTQMQTTSTSYDYNQSNYLVKDVFKYLSNGDETIKSMTYSADYGNLGVFPTMMANNMICEPVATRQYYYHTGDHQAFPGGLLSEKVTEYAQIVTGAIKPSRILEQRFSATQSNYSTYTGPGGTLPATFEQIGLFHYDANGNLTGLVDEGGRTAANIYDYNDKYVVASVINADAVLDMPAYTSFETTSLGGWSFSGSGTSTTGAAVTGSQYFPLSGGTFSAPLNTGKAYRVSFWSNSSSVTVASGSLVSSAPTINGYTYYEYLLPVGATTASVTGTGNIDELRLYPANSRMRTSTYDVIMGKTSGCDENNRVSSFTYDDLGRLQFAKDEYGNILKMYEYSYADNNGAACLTTYTNNEITEQFTRQTCPSGYQGLPTTYLIPAGKYTSTIGQPAADQQAQYELDQLGQAAADNQTGTAGCAFVYTNDALPMSFQDQNCPDGYKGNSFTYTVLAGKYTSIISHDDAQQQAIDDMNANGQAWANLQSNACVLDNDADLEWTGLTACLPNGHMQLQFKDLNPNSPSYNQLSMVDTGASSACTVQIYAKLSFANTTIDNNANGFRYISSDIVIKFYLDAGLTQPVSVSNLQINWHGTETCTGSSTQTYSLTTVTVSGSQATLATQQLTSSVELTDGHGHLPPQPYSCNLTYVLDAGNYTISN